MSAMSLGTLGRTLLAEATAASAENATAVEFCDAEHPTLSHRINNPDDYNWCAVPHRPWDTLLFAGIAVVIACLSQGPYSSLIVLVAGGALMGLVYPFNLREIGNGVALWLGIEPYELFFYIFLPPLLLDAALKIDWYIFKKVALNVVTLAFLVVASTCAVLIPVMLYVFWLKPSGWQWYDAALFGSIIASTDAVAIVAVLKKSGGPERLRIILEGESLLNDASSITLFTIFIEFVIEAAEGHPNTSSAGHIVGTIVRRMIWLAVGGGLIGIGFGIATRFILRFLQRFGATAEQQIALTLACGYLSFYTANAPAKVSGVVAVAVFGLYGAATSKFDISAKLRESGAFEDFWDTFAFVANGIVFFFAGASSMNFVIRSASSLSVTDQQELFGSLWRAPLVWLMLNVLRFVLIVAFRPLFWAGRAPLTLRDCLFCAVSGLRGSISLILAQAVVTEVPAAVNSTALKVQSEVVLFTAVFVLLTLLVNAPLLPVVLRMTKLDAVPVQHQKMRRKALRLLLRHTYEAVDELRDDNDEMLRGVDWDAVKKYVDMGPRLEAFVNPADARPLRKPTSVPGWLAAACCCWQRRDRRGGRRTSYQEYLDRNTAVLDLERGGRRSSTEGGGGGGDGEAGGGKGGDMDGKGADNSSPETTTDDSDPLDWTGSDKGNGQAFEPPDEGRREIQMTDTNEDSLDGELPFLPRDTRDSEDGNAERGRRSSAGGLPTHEAPPPRGFLGRRSVAQQRLAHGSAFAPGPPPKRMASVSMASALSRSASAVAPSEASATSVSPLLPLGALTSGRAFSVPPPSAAAAGGDSTQQALSTAAQLQDSQATIKRAPEEQRRSLADLFGGNVGGTSAAPTAKPQHRSLASLFPAASGSLSADAAANSLAAADGPSLAAAQQNTSGDLDADGAAVVSPRQRPVRQLAQQIEERTNSPQKDGAASQQGPPSPSRSRGAAQAAGNPLQPPASTSGISHSNRPSQHASPAVDDDRSLRQRFEVASPRLPAAERAATHAEAGSGPAEAQPGASRSALVQDERQPLTDEEAAGVEAPDVRGESGSIGSTSSSEPSPHGRLSEAYAHLSTSADAEDHQNSIQSNASARGALAGLRWGSETEIKPATRSDSAPVAAAGGAGVTTTTAPQGSTAGDGLAAAAPAPEAQLAAADSGAAAVDDWGQHPKSPLGNVASLTGPIEPAAEEANQDSATSLSRLAGRVLAGASTSLERVRSLTPRPSLKGLFPKGTTPPTDGNDGPPSGREVSPRKGSPRSPRHPRGGGLNKKSAIADWESASGSEAGSRHGKPGKKARGHELAIADEDIEMDAEEPSSEDVSRHREAVEHCAVDGAAAMESFTAEPPAQRHAFRAKPTLDIAAPTVGSSFGTAGPSDFGSGPGAAQAAEDEQSLTWTSGMARRSLKKNSSGLSHAHSSGELPEESAAGATDNLGTRMMSGTALNHQHSWHMGVLPKQRHMFSSAAPSSTGNSLTAASRRSAAAATDEEFEAPAPQPAAEEVADMRARICAGMKRYFHTKQTEGLLSNRGLRILDHGCDIEIDDPDTPLSLWDSLEKEVTGGWLRAILVRGVFRLRRFGIKLKRSKWGILRWGLGVPGYQIVALGQRLLSKQLLLSCEVAMEYLLALTHSPQVHWLWEHEASRVLMEEVEAETAKVWKFIIDREIEAPERFRSIQSYRAAMAVLRQQLVFVERLAHSGMVTEQEGSLMAEPVDTAIRVLAHRGPTWRAPLVIDVLRSLPIMRQVPAKVLEQVLAHGRLLMYRSGRQIHESAPDEGIFIVCSGLVRVRYDVWQGTSQTYFLGTGGMFGLFSALTGESLAGRAVAIAEGNALGKGPVVFELPPSGIALVRARAAQGDPIFMQLEVDMFRLAALYVVERLREQLLAHIADMLKAACAAKERQSRRGDGRRPSRAEQRLRSLFDAGDANSPELGVEGRRVQKRPASEGPRALQALLEAAGRDDSVRGPSAASAAPQTAASRAAAAKRQREHQAEVVYAELRQQLGGGELVELPQGGTLRLEVGCSAVLLRGSAMSTCDAAGVPAGFCEEGSSLFGSPIPEHGAEGEEHHAPALLPWVWTTRAAAGAAETPKDGEGSMPGGGSSTAGSEAPALEERIEVSRPARVEAGEAGATLVVCAGDEAALDAVLGALPPPPPLDDYSRAHSSTAPGARKWASERWAGAADIEGGSTARVAELLEAVPRSVSAPMRALTAALPPKLLKPLGTVLPGSLRRGGDSGTQDSATSFRLGTGRSASATVNGTPRGDSSSIGSDSGRAPPTPAAEASGRAAAGSRSRASGVRFGDGVAQHDGDSREEYAAGDYQAARPALARRSSRRLSVGGSDGELRAPHLQRKSMADMLKSQSGRH